MRAHTALTAVGLVSLLGTVGTSALAGAGTPATARHTTAGATSKAVHVSLFNAGRVNARATSSASTDSSAAPAGPSGTLYVNGATGSDTGTCRLQSHPCHTIDYAISKAPQTATIKVTNGTYPEQVVVSTAGQHITIEGASETKTVIKPSSLATSDADTDSGSPVYAIVDAQPKTTVKLEDLRVNGAAARNQFDSCSNDFGGVYYHDANGTLSKVTVTGIELPTADFGCQQGLAIYAASDSGSTSVVTMTSVTVNKYDKNGITCDDAGTTCTIKSSTVTGIGATNLIGQNGIQGFGAHKMVLSKDTVTGNTYTGPTYVATGLILYDNVVTKVTSVTANSDDVGIYAGNDSSAPATTTIDIVHSTASNATNQNGAGGLGIGLDSATAGTLNSDTVQGDNGGGIFVWGSSGVTLENSSATRDLDGIYIGGPGSDNVGSTGDTITMNTTSSNTNDGILADTDATGNTFSSNVANTNTGYDYEDDSTGTGTAGTANTWSMNTCTPAHDSQPEGLC